MFVSNRKLAKYTSYVSSVAKFGRLHACVEATMVFCKVLLRSASCRFQTRTRMVALILLSLLTVLVVLNMIFFNAERTFKMLLRNSNSPQVEAVKQTESASKIPTRAVHHSSSYPSQESLIFDTPDQCFTWKNSDEDWSDQIEPQIKLHPDRFLYPGVFSGPNNQMIEFWQAIYLAIRLNRTLVVPKFLAHKMTSYSYHKTGKGIIPAAQRINLRRLRRLVSCIPLEDFRKTCNGSFDVAFQPSAIKRGTIAMIEEVTSMNIFHVEKKMGDKTAESTTLRLVDYTGKTLPSIPTLPGKNYSHGWLPSSGSELRKIFNTAGRCAVYIGQWWGVRIEPQDNLAQALDENVIDDVDRVPDSRLHSAVVDAVRHPSCVDHAARKFVTEAYNDDQFVAVHWRFDKDDWKRVICKIRPSYQKICDDLDLITADDVANGIHASIKASPGFADNTSRIWKYAYIAVPPSLNSFKKELHQALFQVNPDLILPRFDLESFLLKNFESCWKKVNWADTREILSMVEMELMEKSEWFFYSVVSTWSSTIQVMRSRKLSSGILVKKFEASVYEVARRQMARRVGEN